MPTAYISSRIYILCRGDITRFISLFLKMIEHGFFILKTSRQFVYLFAFWVDISLRRIGEGATCSRTAMAVKNDEMTSCTAIMTHLIPKSIRKAM